MSLIQDKLGNEFLRSNGGMEPGFGPGMLMFSHLPPVTSFTRLASQTVMTDLQPHEMILKKERDSPDCGGGGGLSAGGMGGGGGIGGMMGSVGDYVHAMGIKQEKVSEHDYRLPLYPGVVELEYEVEESCWRSRWATITTWWCTTSVWET